MKTKKYQIERKAKQESIMIDCPYSEIQEAINKQSYKLTKEDVAPIRRKIKSQEKEK